MKILMATSHYYPTSGGSERQAHQLARALIARGHEVRVLTMRAGPGPTAVTVEGVPVYRAIRGIERGPLFWMSYLVTSIGAMLRFGRRAEILHVHHLYLDALASAVIGRRLGTPTLAKVACGGAGGDLSRLRRTGKATAILRVLRRLDRVVVLSGETEAEMREAGFSERQIVRIPNGVDVTRFRPGPESPARRPPRTVLFLGRLDAQKGVDTLIAAWVRIARDLPGVTLAIGGHGPEAAALRALAANAAVADRVRFLGVVPDPEEHLRTADAFVLPSLFEGLPNALLEAMATGLPCVATAIGGTTDVATDGRDALLVPPADAAALATALRRVLTDADLAEGLGAAARRRAADHFSLDRMVARYEALYREMRDAA